MFKNLFISFEGTDGSGKSTQIKLLEEYFIGKKLEFLVTREPGGTQLSEDIRNILIDPKNNICSYSEALLYAAARAQHVFEIIQPAIKNSKTVISDRFVDSSLVYQGFARGLGVDTVFRINEMAINGFMPDITFFLDILPEESLKRRKKASFLDRIELESLEFHNDVYQGYKKLAEIYPKRIKVIDASKPEAEINNEVIRILEEIWSQ